jgi:hypothetical protein
MNNRFILVMILLIIVYFNGLIWILFVQHVNHFNFFVQFIQLTPHSLYWNSKFKQLVDYIQSMQEQLEINQLITNTNQQSAFSLSVIIFYH